MGAAEGIACEEVRASKPGDTLRQQLPARFAPGLDTLEKPWPEPPSTLLAVTATVWHWRQQRTGGLPETIVAYVHGGEHDRQQSPVHGGIGCCRPERSSAVPSQPWGVRYRLSGPRSLVGRGAWATIPATTRGGGREAHRSISPRPRPLGSRKSRMTRPRRSCAI